MQRAAMAAEITTAIKKCKLSPEAGAAELRNALDETTELEETVATDAAAAAAAVLKSGSPTARGHALAACAAIAVLAADANAAAGALAAVLETTTDWAARGALADGLKALVRDGNAGDGAGLAQAATAAAAAATKASGGGDDAAAAAARTACWAACAACGAHLAAPAADVTAALTGELKAAAAPAARGRAPAALCAAAALLREGPGDEHLAAHFPDARREDASPWVAALRTALPALEALAPKAPPKKPKVAGPAYAAAQNVLALLSATPKARAKALSVAVADGGAVLFAGADATSRWAAASVLRRAFENEAVASFASVAPHCWRGLARSATDRSAYVRFAARRAVRSGIKRYPKAVAATHAEELWALARTCDMGDGPKPIDEEGNAEAPRPDFRRAVADLLRETTGIETFPGPLAAHLALLCHHAAVASPKVARKRWARIATKCDLNDAGRALLQTALLQSEDEPRAVTIARRAAAAEAFAALGGDAWPLVADALRDATAHAPSADARRAWAGRVTRESDAPSLFEGTASTKAKAVAKTAKRGKLYESDDAAWEAEVRKDLAKKAPGPVDDAVSRRVAQVAAAVDATRAAATAAVDAFVALAVVGTISAGTRGALDALAALNAAFPDLGAAAGFMSLAGGSAVLGAALHLAHAQRVGVVLTPVDSTERRLVERGLLALDSMKTPAPCLALACAALEASPTCFNNTLPHYEPPLRTAFVVAARAVRKAASSPHVATADAISAILALARAAAVDDQLRLLLDKAGLDAASIAAELCAAPCDAATTMVLCGGGPRAAGLLSGAAPERLAARRGLEAALAHASPLSPSSQAAVVVTAHFSDNAPALAADAAPADALVRLALDDADDDAAYADARAAARRACAGVADDVWASCRGAFDASTAPEEEDVDANAFAAPGDDSLERSKEAKIEARASKARRRRRAAELMAALCASGNAPADAFPWVVSKLDDPDDAVRTAVVQLGVACVDHDKDAGLAAKIKACEDALAKDPAGVAVTLLGAAASHLAPDDARVADVADRLVDVLVATTPTAEPVAAPAAKKKPRQVAAKTGIAAIGMAPAKKNPFKLKGKTGPRLGAADLQGLRKTRAQREGSVPEKKVRTFDVAPVANCLGKLAKTMKKTHAERAGTVVARLLTTSFADRDPKTRRKAAAGLAAVVKGLGIGSLKTHAVVDKIKDSLEARQSGGDLNAAHGALSCVEYLARTLGVLFEPYEIKLLGPLLSCFADSSDVVRLAAKSAAQSVFGGLSAHGVKLALPAVLTQAAGEATTSWRARVAAIEMLGATAACAPKQLGAVLPKAVPALADALADTHDGVREAARKALEEVFSVASNDEIRAIRKELLAALCDPAHSTLAALEALEAREFARAPDAPALALLAPILARGMRDRTAVTKRRALLVCGNLAALCAGTSQEAALAPHLPLFQPLLEMNAVGDAHPDVRLAGATALAQVVDALGVERVPFVIQRLTRAALSKTEPDACGDIMEKKNDDVLAAGASERSGAAQALSLVCVESETVSTLMRDEIAPLSRHRTPAAREGALWCIRFLARDDAEFGDHVQDALKMILDGLADDADAIRDVALLAGRQLVRSHGDAQLHVLLPSLEGKLLGSRWRIREAAARLVGELLCLIGGAKQVGAAEFDDADAALGDEEVANKLRTRIGGAAWRNTISSLYIARLDAVQGVRQAAVEVWKTIVPSTPRMLREVLETLVRRLVAMLTPTSTSQDAALEESRGPHVRDSEDESDEDDDEADDVDVERQRVASRALGDVVLKIGDRVISELMPLLQEAFDDGDEATRVGVCLGLAEVCGACPHRQANEKLDLLAPPVVAALCGPHATPRVVAHAALAFHALHRQAKEGAVEAVVPKVLRRLDNEADERGAARARSALREICRKRANELLPGVVPQLLKKPMTQQRADALGAVADVAAAALRPFVATVVRAALAELGAETQFPEAVADGAAAVAAAVAAGGDASAAVGPLASPFADNAKAPLRRDAATLAAAFFRACDARCDAAGAAPDCRDRLLEAAPLLLRELLHNLAEPDDACRARALEALGAYGDCVDVERQAEHLDLYRATLQSAASAARLGRGQTKEPVPALSRDAGLKILLPPYLHSLLHGDAERRESAALGIAELVRLSSEVTLKPVAIKVAGPLIRVGGDRFGGPVKAAVLEALSALLEVAPKLVKAFVPQLQATFAKALRDPALEVRRNGVNALGLLAPLSTRLDALVTDLSSGATADDAPDAVAAACLKGLKAVFENATGPKPPSQASRDVSDSAYVEAASTWGTGSVHAIEASLLHEDGVEFNTGLSPVLRRARLTGLHQHRPCAPPQRGLPSTRTPKCPRRRRACWRRSRWGFNTYSG